MRSMTHDKLGNAIQGNVLTVDCRNSFLYSEKRLLAAIGLEGICVIETPDAILIVKRGQTQRVRQIVDQPYHLRAR